ncbi:FAD-dependent monooxygenase [Actinomadura xylanilytica]|uniref:FAD-dependent monooxygenase n=1 Tax=Actinomadura xylanilytica TaxID=887459 RepID=UPI00255B1405|nr:FAD-dependent monooxygenase [Actinomadura xylanilytica]MDL4774116.1 FAD-dependent monooxygenase [Actinomadura xylanilytica]
MSGLMETEVLIVGAGPVGLTVAVELARRGVPCRVVEERSAPRESTRGCTVYQRTLEVFDAMGLPVDDYVAEGARMAHRVYHLFGERIGTVDMAEPGSARPYPLVVGQNVTERYLERRLADLGVLVQRGTSAGAVTQENDGVTVTLHHEGGRRSVIRAAWLVAAQGAASGVRDSLGVAWREWRRFTGLQMLQIDARVRLPFGLAPDEAHLFFGAGGHVGCVPLPDGRHRVFVVRRSAGGPDERGDPRPAEIAAAMERLCGVGEVGLSEGSFAWRVRLQNRFAERMRVGRVLLAGDSARVFAPVHAQGMNTGVQDAFNLGWKLAAVAGEGAPEALLDSYEAERRPVAEELLARTERSLDFGVQESPGRDPLLAAIAVNRPKRTQLAIDYPDSPLTRDLLGEAAGSRAGRRAPGRWDGRWTLLVLPGPRPDRWGIGRLMTGLDSRVDVIVDVDGEASSAMNAAPDAPAIHLIRPDGHIGLRGGLEHGPQVAAYLDTVLGPVPPRTRSTA